MRDGETLVRIRMEDARAREPAGHQLRVTLPGDPGALAPPGECPSPRSRHLVPERVQTAVVPRHRVVVEVSLYHRPRPLPRLRDRPMPAAAELPLHFAELRPQSLGDGLAPDGVSARDSGHPTDVGEAQEVKGLGLSFSPLFPVTGGKTPKFNQARLLRVQFQPELPQAFLQLLQEPLRFRGTRMISSWDFSIRHVLSAS